MARRINFWQLGHWSVLLPHIIKCSTNFFSNENSSSQNEQETLKFLTWKNDSDQSIPNWIWSMNIPQNLPSFFFYFSNISYILSKNKFRLCWKKWRQYLFKPVFPFSLALSGKKKTCIWRTTTVCREKRSRFFADKIKTSVCYLDIKHTER